MNTNPDSEREDALLETILRDENWQSTDAVFKAAALGSFRARHRARRMMRWTGCAVAVAAWVACGMYWLAHHPTSAPPQIAAKPPGLPRESSKQRYLTDDELVASFPVGSCFLAEIDGKKHLVFLDQDVERQYVAKGEQESVARLAR